MCHRYSQIVLLEEKVRRLEEQVSTLDHVKKAKDFFTMTQVKLLHRVQHNEASEKEETCVQEDVNG